MVCDAGQGAALRIAIILAWRGRSGRDQASEGGRAAARSESAALWAGLFRNAASALARP